jgi:ABC-type bacteriocin/lantibiotic exporter with double-glycine peptidase domain
METKKLKRMRRTFVLQHDASDCGVACLLSLVRYYGGENSLENLRNLSGTNVSGTSLLGLSQAATHIGFIAQGCKADMEALIQHPSPVILHVHLNDFLQHYVVCYGHTTTDDTTIFPIGDPEKGIIKMSREELANSWRSGFCLTLEVGGGFKKEAALRSQRNGWFKSLITEDLPLLSVASGLGIVIAILGTTMMIFSQRLIDNIIPTHDYVKLYLGVLLVILLLLMREGANALRTRFLIDQSRNFNLRIIDRFYNHLLRLPASFFETRKTGEFTARLNDTARVQKVISQLAGNTIIDGLAVLVLFCFLFMYSWQVALICLVALPLYYWLIYTFNKPIRKEQHNIMANYAMAESNFISTFQGIDPIRNYTLQSLFKKRNDAVYTRYQDTIFSLGQIQIKLTFLANGFGVLFLGTVILWESYSVFHGHGKVGVLMAVLGMCTSLLTSVANLALVSIPLNEARIAFNRMMEYTNMDTENEAGLAIADLSSISIRDISFRFPGRIPLLKGISIEVAKGEIIAIMGENGCGKSTIGKIIQKKYAPEKGMIIVNGNMPLDSISLTSWRKIVGVAAQDIHLFNGTVLENIAFDDAQNNPAAVVQFLREYGFEPFINSLPQSYMTIVGETGIALSGGQKQMITFARALYHRPQLLILDETNSALDRLTERFMLDLLSRLKKDIAIIFITHRLHTLRSVCDRIYVINNGTVSVSGSHHDLLQSENLYSLYWQDLKS